MRRFVNSRFLTTSAFSLVMLGLALTMVWLGQNLGDIGPKKVTVREIAVLHAAPPPPPPPPVTTQQVVDTAVSVQVQGTGAALTLLDPETRPLQIDRPTEPTLKTLAPEMQSLEVDWQAFGLDELDGFPSLLTPLRVSYPKELSRKGIRSVLVKLDILIDEHGQVSLIEIVQNPYPELAPELVKLVRTTRFTPPKKGSEAVRARFIWPVEISA